VTDSIVVTGALGGSGSWIVESLRGGPRRRRGRPDAAGAHRRRRRQLPGPRLDRPGAIWETVLDADPSAVVHFGNIPHEENNPGGDVYENNALSTFHALEAAGRAGADVVWASSETVYGTHWPEPTLPEYLPIDEAHPVEPWNGYETSKLAGEAAAERVTNRFDVSRGVDPSVVDQYPRPVPDYALP